jgi:hypothetical protein
MLVLADSNTFVGSVLASAQLGALMKVRNLKLQYKYLNTWRLNCESSKCVARTNEEMSGRMARLEAGYKQEIAELQGRLDRLRDSCRANVIEHLERVHQKTSRRRALSLWKTAVIRALACANEQPQMVDEGTTPMSPSAAVDEDHATLEKEVADLQEQIRYTDPKMRAASRPMGSPCLQAQGRGAGLPPERTAKAEGVLAGAAGCSLSRVHAATGLLPVATALYRQLQGVQGNRSGDLTTNYGSLTFLRVWVPDVRQSR